MKKRKIMKIKKAIRILGNSKEVKIKRKKLNTAIDTIVYYCRLNEIKKMHEESELKKILLTELKKPYKDSIV